MSTYVFLVYFDDTQFGPSPSVPTLMKVCWSRVAAIRAVHSLYEEQRAGADWKGHIIASEMPVSWRPHVKVVYRLRGGPNPCEPRYDVYAERWPVSGSPLEALAEIVDKTAGSSE